MGKTKEFLYESRILEGSFFASLTCFNLPNKQTGLKIGVGLKNEPLLIDQSSLCNSILRHLLSPPYPPRQRWTYDIIHCHFLESSKNFRLKKFDSHPQSCNSSQHRPAHLLARRFRFFSIKLTQYLGSVLSQNKIQSRNSFSTEDSTRRYPAGGQ